MGLLRWAAAIAFTIVIAASGVRVVYAHQHDQTAESVSTAAGTVALAVHLQLEAHDDTPSESLHYHEAGALAHSPAAMGAITCNVPLVVERTLFPDPLCAAPQFLPESFLRPPTR